MTACCDGVTYLLPNGAGGSSWAVLCSECHRVLAVVDAPREEVYAHL